MKFVKLIFTLLFIGIVMSCEKENDGVASDFSIVGYAQKGQFIKGATITAYALNNKLSATGESFPSTIKDDLGSFAISAEVVAPYLELKAEGYYFVENTGETSASPIYLNALVSSSQAKVNINLLTTVTCGRIKKLINEGKSFDSAKKQAEREIVHIFSIKSEDIAVGFEEMNISEDGNANAVLLAISCLIQEGRNAGEVQKMISDISSEFEVNGTVSDKLLSDIFDGSRYVSISNVVRNLITYYNKNGVSDFKIPPFYAVLNKEYSKGFHIIDMGNSSIGGMYDIGVEGGIKEYYAISYEDFITESDVDWIEAEVLELCSNLYKLKIKISPNSGVSGRKGCLQVKSKSGNTLYSNTTNQSGNGQRIYIELQEVSPRARGFQDGDKVNINGTDHTLLFDTGIQKYYVELPKSDEGYGISNMPEMVVAGKNGDVLCATFTYKSEVDEFIEEVDDMIELRNTRSPMVVGMNNDISIGVVRAGKNPCYAALKGMRGYELGNPALAKLEIVCALLTLEFKYKGSSVGPEFAKLKVEFGSDGFLAGEVTTCMYPDQAMYDPSYVVPKTEYKNRSNKVTVHNIDNNSKVSLWVHPQILSTIHCTAYSDDGSVLFEAGGDMYGDLRKGTNSKYIFTIADFDAE